MRWMRGTSVSTTPGGLEVRWGFRPAGYQVIVAALAEVRLLLLGQPWLAAAVLLILPAGALLNRFALRLTADERGVVVLNYGVVTRFVWPAIAAVTLRTSWWGASIEVSGRDGRRTRAWVTNSARGKGLRNEELGEVVRRLERLRRTALGTAPGPPLASADDHGPAHGGPIDADLYVARLHGLAARGEADMEALRRARQPGPGEPQA